MFRCVRVAVTPPCEDVRVTSYTTAQAEAIACLDEPLQIIACAGSGKTQVISQRIAAILALPAVEPRNVVAFTFTERAAAELKERILSSVERELGEVTGLAEMYVGTMHGYALNLLQRLVPDKFKFSVLTDITAQLFVDRYSTKSGLTTCPTTAKRGVLWRYKNSRLYLQVLSVLREDRIDLERVDPGVIDSFHKYMTLLDERSLFDYTQIILSAVSYLEGDPYEDEDFVRVQQHIKDDIKYVVVDEYQDVNPLQERLVRGLVQFGANLCVVGDDDQTCTSGAAARSPTSSPSSGGTRACGRSPSTTTSGRAEAWSNSGDRWPNGSPPTSGSRRR